VVRALTWAVAASCTVRTPHQAPAEVSACEQLLREGDAKRAAEDLSAAEDHFAQARRQCEDPRPAGMKLASTLARAGRPDDAAAVLTEIITVAHPPLDAFLELERLLPELSPQARARLTELGSQAEAPVHVPSRALEYSWVGAFACPEGHPQVSAQTELRGPTWKLDAVEVACGESAPRRIYFVSDAPNQH
jgi:hypothetical protein